MKWKVREWHKQIQALIEENDFCIKNKNDETLTLSFLAEKLGYSEFYVSRKFKEISGMSLRDYMGQRKLSFALKEVRDTTRGLIDIAFDYDSSGYELDITQGRVFYFYHDCKRFWKYVRPVRKIN